MAVPSEPANGARRRMPRPFVLPDLGEGLTEAEIVKVLVNEGDVLVEDAPLLEVETDKATVEIPSPFAGRVARIHVRPGQSVKVGEVLVTFEDSSGVALGGGGGAAGGSAGFGTPLAGAPSRRPAPPPAAARRGRRNARARACFDSRACRTRRRAGVGERGGSRRRRVGIGLGGWCGLRVGSGGDRRAARERRRSRPRGPRLGRGRWRRRRRLGGWRGSWGSIFGRCVGAGPEGGSRTMT